ncbi:hypothetical protein KCU65_g7188, partial [Aureobasidium melanogenum]
MAPISHFAIAVLAATSVVAAPLPTPPNSAATLQPRGWIEDLIEETNFFGKYVNDKIKVEPKTMLENALKVEKQLKGEHDKRDASPIGIIPRPGRTCTTIHWSDAEGREKKKGGDE